MNARCCRYSGNSYSLIGGWGPFEVIDMAVAMGAEPIITTTSSSSPESFADLVEYLLRATHASSTRSRISIKGELSISNDTFVTQVLLGQRDHADGQEAFC